MSDDMKHIILVNVNVKLYSWPLYVSQGSAATDLRGGGSFNSFFFRRSFLNLAVKTIVKIGSRLPKLSQKSYTYFWDTG